MRRAVLFTLGFPLTLSLLATGPPPEGVETRFAAGSGSFEYTSGGCGGPTYANRAVEGAGFASGSYRHENGVAVATEVSVAVARTKSSRLIDRGDDLTIDIPAEDEDEVGRINTLTVATARVGYHWDYLGAEVGPGVAFDGAEAAFVPSAMLWAGVPDVVYAWGALVEGPTSIGHIPLEAGLGHRSDRVRANLGVGFEPSIIAEGGYRFFNNAPLFIGGRVVQIVAEERKGTVGALTVELGW